MIDKSKSSLSEVLSQIKDGATILIGGFGTAGQPAELIEEERGKRFRHTEVRRIDKYFTQSRVFPLDFPFKHF